MSDEDKNPALQFVKLAAELAVIVEFCLKHDGGEFLGDHPEALAYAQKMLAKAYEMCDADLRDADPS